MFFLQALMAFLEISIKSQKEFSNSSIIEIPKQPVPQQKSRKLNFFLFLICVQSFNICSTKISESALGSKV